MIEQLERVSEGPTLTLRLTPNRSVSGPALAAFFALLATTAVLVAVFSARQGNVFAPVFALLDLGFVGAALWYAWHALDREELIAFGADAVTVTRRPGPATASRFHPYWVRVASLPGRRRSERARLVLTSHGEVVEIGAFLGDEEREELKLRLRGALARFKQGG